MKIIKEAVNSVFKGTVVDLETQGYFLEKYEDSRRYAKHTPVFFGFITKDGMEIHCAEKSAEINDLLKNAGELLSDLPRPFHAFNTDFERGVLFHALGQEILFEKELNKKRYEAKESAVAELKLPTYNDPFKGNGKLFLDAWKNGNMKDCIAHNRADLLKEKDILLKRGSRQPDPLNFVKI